MGEWRGAAGIVLVGAVLGVAYNYLGLNSRPAFGIAWIRQPVEVATLETAAGSAAQVVADDPLAAALGAGAPEIPDLPRPIQVQLVTAKQLFDAQAALFVDARDPDEFEAGHVPGSVNLPFDVVVTDPARLEALPAAGRPIVVYCGGGSCETAINLAQELLNVGHRRVTFFLGGYPEWQGSGYPVSTGVGEAS